MRREFVGTAIAIALAVLLVVGVRVATDGIQYGSAGELIGRLGLAIVAASALGLAGAEFFRWLNRD